MMPQNNRPNAFREFMQRNLSVILAVLFIALCALLAFLMVKFGHHNTPNPTDVSSNWTSSAQNKNDIQSDAVLSSEEDVSSDQTATSAESVVSETVKTVSAESVLSTVTSNEPVSSTESSRSESEPEPRSEAETESQEQPAE